LLLLVAHLRLLLLPNACRHAFAADSLLLLVYQIVRGSYPPIPADMFSADMQHLVQQLLTSDAAQRPSLQQVRCSCTARSMVHMCSLCADHHGTLPSCGTPGITAAAAVGCEP
jgi:hypothetical protein